MIPYSLFCILSFGISDSFADPLDIGIEIGGTPYSIDAGWTDMMLGFDEVPCK